MRRNGWRGPLEATGQKQAEWRTDPSRSGPGGAISDFGSHAFDLACFVTGCVPEQLLADLWTFVAGRRVDDNAHWCELRGRSDRDARRRCQPADDRCLAGEALLKPRQYNPTIGLCVLMRVEPWGDRTGMLKTLKRTTEQVFHSDCTGELRPPAKCRAKMLAIAMIVAIH
jgi:hypothetical protein